MFDWLKRILRHDEPEKSVQELTFVVSRTDVIDSLRMRGRHATKTDLINTALTMYSWALDAIDEGRVIGSINERDDTYRELSLPAFENLKKQIPWGTWVDLDEDYDEGPCECEEDGETWA